MNEDADARVMRILRLDGRLWGDRAPAAMGLTTETADQCDQHPSAGRVNMAPRRPKRKGEDRMTTEVVLIPSELVIEKMVLASVLDSADRSNKTAIAPAVRRLIDARSSADADYDARMEKIFADLAKINADLRRRLNSARSRGGVDFSDDEIGFGFTDEQRAAGADKSVPAQPSIAGDADELTPTQLGDLMRLLLHVERFGTIILYDAARYDRLFVTDRFLGHPERRDQRVKLTSFAGIDPRSSKKHGVLSSSIRSDIPVRSRRSRGPPPTSLAQCQTPISIVSKIKWPMAPRDSSVAGLS
jgi:hypothetical protein